MLKLFIFIFCVYVGQKLTSAALARLPPQEKPKDFADHEGCYIPDLNTVLGYNAPYSPADGTNCVQYLCQSDGETLIETCGAIGVGPNCKIIKGNLYLPYPRCCDTVECNKDNQNDCHGHSHQDHV